MKTVTLLKALVVTLPLLCAIACAGPSTYARAAGTDGVGPYPAIAEQPGGGIMSRAQYEHSASYPPG
jgi:hypothetical protein